LLVFAFSPIFSSGNIILMGEQKVNSSISVTDKNRFIHHLLKDLDALEYMLAEDWLEKDMTRIGAEQELCLVDYNYRPSMDGPAILQTISDSHFTTELARYNLEMNLDPLVLKSGAFSTMEANLKNLLADASVYAAPFGNKVLLCGILPSITPRELDLSYLTPKPRYYALDRILREMRDSDFDVYIQGNDELLMRHNNILLEACNTSFQVHLQINPADFTDMYNWAQLISGPVLSVCTNSPLLFGKELWAETRIALFQQSLDVRTKTNDLRQRKPRVNFGNAWVLGSVTELIKDDIARFPMILTGDTEDSFELIKNGIAPKLRAFQLHNGTIWKWNRPCYGLTNGKPHLRIECRYIPSGPTPEDEIANAAFWVGLMQGLPDHYRKLQNKLDFTEVKENFVKAARYGINTELKWNGRFQPARNIILNDLLPIAEQGLLQSGCTPHEASDLLKTIRTRAETLQTGSRWQVKQFRELKNNHEPVEAQLELTAILYEKQQQGHPVAEWNITRPTGNQTSRIRMAEECMNTDILSVREDDPAELVARMMEWKNIHHVPVENQRGELMGLITTTHLKRHVAERNIDPSMTAGQIMIRKFHFIVPGTTVMEAMQLMIREQISCLPVLKDGKLCGIVTEKDMERVWKKMKGESE
jgi:CBS domain-containing protein